MQARRHRFWWHLLMDIPILLLVGGATLLFEIGILPSHKAGFRCKDPALAFPYVGDTVTIGAVASTLLIIPFILIWISEAVLYRQDEYTIKQNKLWVSGKTTASIYRDYIYGAVLNLVIMEIGKCLVGYPRPTFFDLCEPDMARTCNGSEFINNFTCTSKKYSQYLQIDSSRSFPSAHASLSVYCGLFVAWYLQRRAFSWRNRSVLVVPFIQLLCLGYAAICSLTRITDRRHHWWDVFVGAVIGLLTVLYATLVLCKNFSQPSVASTSDISNSDGCNNHQSVRRLLSSRTRVVVP